MNRISLPLLLFLNWIGSFSVLGEPVRLYWNGIEESKAYELEVSGDKNFKTDVRNFRFKSSKEVFDLPGGLPKTPVFARVRARLPDQTGSEWVGLRIGRWAPPKLPPKIRIESKEAGSKKIEWEAPANGGAIRLHYRVSLLADDGSGTQKKIYDSLVTENRFTAPLLPAGFYTLQVEPIGDPDSGSLHPEGMGLASAIVLADPVPFDPKAKQQIPHDIVSLTHPLGSGFHFTQSGSLQISNETSKLVTTSTLKLVFDFGLVLATELPVVVADYHANRPWQEDSAPRFGGDPFPVIEAGWKFSGDRERSLGATIGIQLPTNSSQADQNFFPTLIGARGIGQWVFQNWVLGLYPVIQMSLPLAVNKNDPGTGTLQSIWAFGSGISGGYAWLNRRVLMGAKLFGGYRTAVTFVQDSNGSEQVFAPAEFLLTAGPSIQVQVFDWLYVGYEGSFYLSGTPLGPSDQVPWITEVALSARF